VTDIPGESCHRPIIFGETFCTETLGRSINTKVSALKFDVVHIPHDFDFEKTGQAVVDLRFLRYMQP
jgi:hypothetical protein